tara:strand:+ start:5686 stop:5892 length:207 start_codon:yes stop_codon:yes gene_type:complete
MLVTTSSSLLAPSGESQPIISATPDSSASTIIIGVLALVVAFASIAVGVLQLRHMQRRKRMLNAFELP